MSERMTTQLVNDILIMAVWKSPARGNVTYLSNNLLKEQEKRVGSGNKMQIAKPKLNNQGDWPQ
jgi:hypothetical protein